MLRSEKQHYFTYVTNCSINILYFALFRFSRSLFFLILPFLLLSLPFSHLSFIFFLIPLFFIVLHIRRSPMSSFTSHPISSLITSNPARISKNRSYWISNISLYICRSIRNVIIKSNQLDSFNNAQADPFIPSFPSLLTRYSLVSNYH